VIDICSPWSTLSLKVCGGQLVADRLYGLGCSIFFIFHLHVCSDVKTSLMCYFDYVLFCSKIFVCSCRCFLKGSV